MISSQESEKVQIVFLFLKDRNFRDCENVCVTMTMVRLISVLKVDVVNVPCFDAEFGDFSPNGVLLFVQ